MDDLLENLSPAQQRAVNLLRLALAAYNSRDGTGLFQGVNRYSILTERVKIAAVQSRDLPGFWSALLRKMLWPITPKRLDPAIVHLLHEPEPAPVLRALALEAPYCVMLARYLHVADKESCRWVEVEADSFLNDPLDPL